MWYNYFRQNYYFNINNQITINQTQLSIYEIERIKFVGMEPQTIYLETCENYDTIFYGNEIINTDCYLRIFDDVNSDIESDYYNPNAWSRFSINSRINYTFNGTVYIEQQYNYFHIEIIDYLYAY